MWRLLKSLPARRTRLAHTVLGVALAVSLVSGTFVLGDTVDAAFRRASSHSKDGVDLIVRSAAQFTAQGTTLPEREPLPESLLAEVQAVPGVAAAWGSVWGYTELVDKRGEAVSATGLPTVGSAWTPDDTLVAGRAPSRPGEVVIDTATAEEHGFRLGDRIKILFQGVVEEFVIEGIRRVNDFLSSTLANFDLKTAQRVLGQEGRLQEINVRAAAGVPLETLRGRIAAALPERYEVVTSDQAAKEAERSWTDALAFLTTGLLVLAAVALLVGAFLIGNTFSILVAQRTRELALLRAVGASRVQLTASVLVEAVAVGAVASGVGVVLGLGAAHGLLALMRGAGIEPPSTAVVFLPRTAIVALLAGVVVTVAAAVLPARRATAVSPIAGVNPLPPGRSFTARRLLLGVPLTAAGGGAVAFGLSPHASHPVLLAGAGAAGVLLGVATMVPAIARPAARLLGAPLGRLRGEPALLGRENAMRNPARTAATATALMIGIGLVGVVGIMAASMKASAGRAIDDTVLADFVLAPKGTGALGVSPLVATRLRETDGFGVVSEIRGGQWGLGGRAKTLLAVDPATVTAVHRLDAGSTAAVRALDDRGVLVRDTVAQRHGWEVGDEVPMTFARTGVRRLVLRGTFSTTSVRTDYVVSLAAYEANYAQQLDLQVAVRLAPGTSVTEGRSRLLRAVADFPNVDVMDRSQLVADQKEQVDTVLVPVTALLGLSVLIAVLGIANTLALSVHERTRELGLLRAVGMVRSQLRAMIRAEAVIIAALGAVLGVTVAVVLGSVLVAALHDQGVTELVVPVGQLALSVAIAVTAAVLASIVPGRRAARLGVLDAVGRE